jgi:tetratricopeptide (TPR) repeat protein
MRPASGAPAPPVAALYVENVTHPEDRDRLGPITGNLLVTSLAQSSDVNVLGTERILDVLRQLGHEGRKLDRGVALEVARRAHASRLVSGSILQSTPNLVMTAELIDVKSGRVVDAYRVVGEPGQTVFQVVDQLGRRLVSRFASPSEAARLVSVSERASSDLEAVRRYLEGLEQLSHGQFDLAARAFESALERDPDFAQAHYQLAIARWWSAEPENAESELRDAENHQDRLSRAEREALQGIRALVEGRWKNAAEIFQSRLRMDPDDKLALYGLVEASFHGNDYQGAIDAGRRALSVDSSFTLVSVHVVDAAAASHQFALAESVARAGLRISPGNDPLWASYARSLVIKGDGDGALRVVDEVIASGRRDLTVLGAAVVLAMGLDSLAAARRYFDVVRKMPLPAFMLDEIPPMERYGMALRGGRFREAEAIAAERWRLWKRPPPLPRSAGPRIPAADGIDAAVGARDTKLAWLWSDSIAIRVDRWRGSVTPSPGTSVRGITSIRLGRLDDARRELARLEAMPGYEREPAGADYLRGLIRAEEGKTDEALALIAAGNAGGPPGRQIGTKWLDTYRVLAAAGRHVQALSVLDTLIAAPVVSPADAVRLIFYRGQTLEHLGRTAEARSSYQRFLRAWEHADPGIPEVEEARAALRRLGTEPQTSKTTSLR